MLDIRPVIHLMGLLCCCVAVALCVPAVADLIVGSDDWQNFMVAAVLAGFCGVTATLAALPDGQIHLSLRHSFLVTALGWVVVAFFGAIPFYSLGFSLADSVFESMSAITTTGSTVFSDLDSMPVGVLLWRAVLQWIGGIGIIAVAILMLPMLRVGGAQLFRIERSDQTGDSPTNTMSTITWLIAIYIALTVLCGALFALFGMSGFDAATHAMTTLSTGGYSTHDESFGFFDSIGLQWIATVFMIAGALPFYLYIRTLRGEAGALLLDQQVRGFIHFLVLVSIFIAVWLYARGDIGLGEALTLSAFNVTSIVTTTGFASADYTSWGHGAVGAFLVLMFVGGCSGSTSGAIKIYRHQIIFMIVRAYLRRLFSPNRTIPLLYNGRPLPDDVPFSILAFLAAFCATVTVFTVLLSILGIDVLTAYSASLTAITNVGPGLGPIIGPSGNFEPLPDAAKWLLVVAMLAGRLEVLALLVILDRDFWKF